MKTVGENVDEALIKANAVDDTIKTHAIAEVSDWVVEQLRSFRWPFMRDTHSESVSAGSTDISLPADYDKIAMVRWKDANDNYAPLEVRRREEFDRIGTPSTTGLPTICCVFDDKLFLYPLPQEGGTIYLTYWKAIQTAYGVGDEAPFPDAIIKQRAYIAALDYDRLNTDGEMARLDRQVLLLRRNMDDDGTDGHSIALDSNVFGKPPDNPY